MRQPDDVDPYHQVRRPTPSLEEALALKRTPSILLAAESLRPRGSGIGRVARLTGRVLAEAASRGRLSASAIALNDPEPALDLGIPARTASGSRLRFVLAVQSAMLRQTHFVYDFAGMARAHLRHPRKWRPYLAWMHGVDVWEQAKAAHLKALRAADLLVVNSEYTRARAERLHGGFQRARVCWLGTESDAAEPSAGLLAGPPTVLALGRIDVGGGHKGLRELIAIWPDVVAAVPGARLLIGGAGSGEPVIRELAGYSPAASQIELRGYVAEADLPALWSEATVFAMPSRREGFGIAYVEAMQHALPVIGSVHDAAPEVNLEGVTGFNVRLDREGELLDRVVMLLRDRDLAQRLGQAGHARWREHFSFSAFSRRFAPILEELLAL